MNKTLFKHLLLIFLYLISLSNYSLATTKPGSEVQPEIDWELIIPQEILQATVCKWELTEEERLFFENSYY